MIRHERVFETLKPWLGTAFLVTQEASCERISRMLYAFQPERDSLAELAGQIDNLLFMSVREYTNGKLALEMDNGQLIRLRMNDFTLMADELLYLLFEKMERLPFHQALIREYSMRSGSLSALKALYLLYEPYQSEEENQTLHRVITTCHEPWRFRHWIKTAKEE